MSHAVFALAKPLPAFPSVAGNDFPVGQYHADQQRQQHTGKNTDKAK